MRLAAAAAVQVANLGDATDRGRRGPAEEGRKPVPPMSLEQTSPPAFSENPILELLLRKPFKVLATPKCLPICIAAGLPPPFIF